MDEKEPNKNDSALPEKKPGKKDSPLSRLLWTLLFLVIAAATVWAVTSQNRSFSVAEFLAYIRNADPLPLALAGLCAFGFVAFEALTLRCACEPFGHKVPFFRGITYSSADIYFSAITPSATGGQPACAYFMMQNGLSGTAATAVLLANLMMYTLALLVVGILSMLLCPGLFWSYGIFPRFLILLGIGLQAVLAVFFTLLIRNEQLLRKICLGTIHFLCRIRLCRKREKWTGNVERTMKEYGGCVGEMRKHKGMLGRLLVLNILQRVSSISVTLFVYAATRGWSGGHKIWAMQGFALVGSNAVPIPGAMGVSDYLMLSGFKQMMPEQAAANLDLLSRSLSFYFCIVFCGLWVLVNYLMLRRKGKKC